MRRVMIKTPKKKPITPRRKKDRRWVDRLLGLAGLGVNFPSLPGDVQSALS